MELAPGVVWDDGGQMFYGLSDPAIADDEQNCLIRAVSILTPTPYPEIDEAFIRFGRRRGHPTPTEIISPAMNFLGYKLDIFATDYKHTFGTFQKENPDEIVMLTKSGHAVACIEGVRHDTWDCGSRSIVKNVVIIKRNSPSMLNRRP